MSEANTPLPIVITVDKAGLGAAQIHWELAQATAISSTEIPTDRISFPAIDLNQISASNVDEIPPAPQSTNTAATSAFCDINGVDGGCLTGGNCTEIEVENRDVDESVDNALSGFRSAVNRWRVSEHNQRDGYCTTYPNDEAYDYVRLGLHAIQTLYEKAYGHVYEKIDIRGPIVPEINQQATFHNGQAVITTGFRNIGNAGPVSGVITMIVLEPGQEFTGPTMCFGQVGDPAPLCYEKTYFDGTNTYKMVVYMSREGIGNEFALFYTPVSNVNAKVNRELSRTVSFLGKEGQVIAYNPMPGQLPKQQRNLFFPWLQGFGSFFQNGQKVAAAEILGSASTFANQYAEIYGLSSRERRAFYRQVGQQIQDHNRGL